MKMTPGPTRYAVSYDLVFLWKTNFPGHSATQTLTPTQDCYDLMTVSQDQQDV